MTRAKEMLRSYNIIGQAAPVFFEWLMGYPKGHTQEDDALRQRDIDMRSDRYPLTHENNWDLIKDIWQREPAIPRVDPEKKNRQDRTKALGNAIVPQIAGIIWEAAAKSILKGDFHES